MRWLQLHFYLPQAAVLMATIGIRVKTLTIGTRMIVCRRIAACGALALMCWCILAAQD